MFLTDDPTILSAIIISVPPTAAAGAAWVTAFKTKREVSNPNGIKTGEMVEILAQDVKAVVHLLATHTDVNEARFSEMVDFDQDIHEYVHTRFHREENRYTAMWGLLCLIAEKVGIPIPDDTMERIQQEWEGWAEERKNIVKPQMKPRSP